MSSPDAVRAWHAAIQVAVRTRKILTHVPPRGYARLRDQMTRSSESIAHNIAEGRASIFEPKYISHLDSAAASAAELSSQITLALEYGIVPQREAFSLNGTVICTRRMIESLRAKIQTRHDAARRRKPEARRDELVPAKDDSV